METMKDNLIDIQDILYTPESIISACLRNLNGIKQTRQCVRVRGVFTTPSQVQGMAFGQLVGENITMPLRLYFSTREGNMQMFPLLVPGNEYIFTGIISYFVNKDTLSLQLTPIEAKNSANDTENAIHSACTMSDEVKECMRKKKLDGEKNIRKVISDSIRQRNKVLAVLIRPISETAELDMRGSLGNMAEYCKIIPHECDFTKPKEIASLLLKADQTSCDIIILSRGGGDNLWLVDNREVLEALSRLRLPVITGLGHEKDHLMADFLADKVCSVPAMVGVYLRETILQLMEEKKKKTEPQYIPEKKPSTGYSYYNKYSQEKKTFYGIRWTDAQAVRWVIYILCIIGLIQVVSIFL